MHAKILLSCYFRPTPRASWNKMMCYISSCKIARKGTTAILLIVLWLSITCYKHLSSEKLRDDFSLILLTLFGQNYRCNQDTKQSGTFLLHLSHLYTSFGKKFKLVKLFIHLFTWMVKDLLFFWGLCVTDNSQISS